MTDETSSIAIVRMPIVRMRTVMGMRTSHRIRILMGVDGMIVKGFHHHQWHQYHNEYPCHQSPCTHICSHTFF